MEFSGRLASFPIAELLQWAYNDSRTGSLVVRRRSREKRIFFQRGRIVACLSDQPAEFYGQHLLLAGYLDEATLLAAIARCRREGKRLGVVLEDEGVLTLGQVGRTLRQHLEDIICDIFLWRHGIFFFQAEPPPREEILAEPIDTLAVALEGSRWTDDYRRLRADLKHDQLILARARGLDEIDPAKLQPRQLRVLGEADGERTLEELYHRVNGSYFRFLQAAHELCLQGVLEVHDILARGAKASTELPLHDLLFEQAAAEQLRATRRYFSSSIGSFERFVPIWVKPPSDEEWERMPDGAREFYRLFDGSHRLIEIFSENEDEWNRQTELLMLQIGKEAVALLPAPLAELEAGEEAETAETAIVGTVTAVKVEDGKGPETTEEKPKKKRFWRRIFGSALD